jgi:site-specific DNA recombinase
MSRPRTALAAAAGPPHTVRVAIYLRRSTDETHQPFSLDAQETKLRAYIASQDGWELVLVYSDDASGATLDRTDLHRALAAARAGRYDLLLVYRVDRLSRSIRGLASILDDLDTAGVAFRSATEPFDTTTPAGRMMVQMLAVFAEFERATIIDRVINGMERKAARGQWCGGYRPYGYELDKTTGFLAPVKAEAAVVRRIFRLYAVKRLGARTIAVALTKAGHRTKAGKPWSTDAVLTVLRNRAYLGEIYFRGTWHTADPHHPPIIEPDIFDTAQAILIERGEEVAHRAANNSDYLLAGNVTCDNCGKRYVGTAVHGNKYRYRYYTCYTRRKYGTDHCPAERLPADQLETKTIDALLDTLTRTDLIDAAVAAHTARRDHHRTARADELAAVDAELDKTNAAIDRYLTAFENGNLDEDTCGQRVQTHASKATQLRARRAELADLLAEPSPAPTPADLGALRDHIRDVLQAGNRPQTKALLHTLIHDIRVTGRHHAIPYFYVPITPSDQDVDGAKVCTPSGSVPPAGFEPAHPPPEGGALSPELRGRGPGSG